MQVSCCSILIEVVSDTSKFSVGTADVVNLFLMKYFSLKYLLQITQNFFGLSHTSTHCAILFLSFLSKGKENILLFSLIHPLMMHSFFLFLISSFSSCYCISSAEVIDKPKHLEKTGNSITYAATITPCATMCAIFLLSL